MSRLIVICQLALVAVAGGCENDEPSLPGSHQPCGAAPMGCPSDETCWAPDPMGPELVCLTAGTGARGEECTQEDVPTCGPGLMCGGVPLSSEPPTCLAFCDPSLGSNGGCLADEVCHALAIGEANVYLCIPSAA